MFTEDTNQNVYIVGVKNLIVGDQVEFVVLDIDENCVSYYKYLVGTIVEKPDGQEYSGYIVELKDRFEKIRLVSGFGSENPPIKKIFVPYFNIVDFVRKFEKPKWTIMKSCKRKWSRLVFRKISIDKETGMRTIKYPDYKDTYQAQIKIPSSSRCTLDPWSFWPVHKKDYVFPDIENREIVCGIVRNNEYIWWCVVPHDFLLIWRCLLDPKNSSVNGKNVLETISKKTDKENNITREATLATLFTDTPKNLKSKVNLVQKSLMWYAV